MYAVFLDFAPASQAWYTAFMTFTSIFNRLLMHVIQAIYSPFLKIKSVSIILHKQTSQTPGCLTCLIPTFFVHLDLYLRPFRCI